jgi:hypothetical protein
MLVVAVAIIAGITAVVTFSLRRGAERVPPANPGRATSPALSTSPMGEQPAATTALSFEMPPSQPAQPIALMPSPSPAPMPGPQESRRRHDARMQALQGEPRDPAWAAAATRALTAQYSSLASSNRFTVRTVDCRTVTCGVEFEWRDFGEAQAWHQALAQMGANPNCGTELYFGPPDDPNRPYRATLLLDCEAFRAANPDWR